MNIPPNRPPFQPGAPHSWPANAPPPNYQSPQPCYNCGSTAHIAQFCLEPRRQVPAGSVNQPARTHRIQKKSSKPIITRYPHPSQYPTAQAQTQTYQPPQPQAYPQQAQPQAYPSQVPPQVYPTQASPSPVSSYPPQQQQQQQQQQSQHWQQPYAYNAHQQWQQPPTQTQPHYSPHVTAASPTAAYGTHQPAAYQGYNQPAAHHPHPQPPQPYYGYPQGGRAPPVHPPAPFNSQFHRPQHQFRQKQPGKHRSQHHAPPFQQQAPRHGSPTQGTHGPSQPASQAAANNRREPPPPKPPPCFPNTQAPITQFGKSGKIVYKPPERAEKPLAATFSETDAQRGEKASEPEKPMEERVFSTKYFDEKGVRIGKYTVKTVEDGVPEDPVYNSVRTGGSMLSQPLEFTLSDDPEKNGDAEFQKLLKELEDEAKMEIYASLNGEDKKPGSEGSLSAASRSPSRGSGASGKVSEGGKEGSKKRGWHKNLEDSSHDGSDDRRHKRPAKNNKRPGGSSPSSAAQPSIPPPQHHPLPPKPKVPGFRGGRGGRHHRHAPSPARQYQVHREGGGGAGRGGGGGGGHGFSGDHVRPVS